MNVTLPGLYIDKVEMEYGLAPEDIGSLAVILRNHAGVYLHVVAPHMHQGVLHAAWMTQSPIDFEDGKLKFHVNNGYYALSVQAKSLSKPSQTVSYQTLAGGVLVIAPGGVTMPFDPHTNMPEGDPPCYSPQKARQKNPAAFPKHEPEDQPLPETTKGPGWVESPADLLHTWLNADPLSLEEAKKILAEPVTVGVDLAADSDEFFEGGVLTLTGEDGAKKVIATINELQVKLSNKNAGLFLYGGAKPGYEPAEQSHGENTHASIQKLKAKIDQQLVKKINKDLQQEINKPAYTSLHQKPKPPLKLGSLLFKKK